MAQIIQLELLGKIKSENCDHYVITILLRNYIEPWIYHFFIFKLRFSTKWSLLRPNMTVIIVLRNDSNYVILKKCSVGFRIYIYSTFGFKLVMSVNEIFGFWSLSDVFDFFEPYFCRLSFVEPLFWYWFWENTFDSLFFFLSAILVWEFSACFSSESIIRWKVFKYGVKMTKNSEILKTSLGTDLIWTFRQWSKHVTKSNILHYWTKTRHWLIVITKDTDGNS